VAQTEKCGCATTSTATSTSNSMSSGRRPERAGASHSLSDDSLFLICVVVTVDENDIYQYTPGSGIFRVSVPLDGYVDDLGKALTSHDAKGGPAAVALHRRFLTLWKVKETKYLSTKVDRHLRMFRDVLTGNVLETATYLDPSSKLTDHFRTSKPQSWSTLVHANGQWHGGHYLPVENCIQVLVQLPSIESDRYKPLHHRRYFTLTNISIMGVLILGGWRMLRRAPPQRAFDMIKTWARSLQT
jgi:hypothetical protein